MDLWLAGCAILTSYFVFLGSISLKYKMGILKFERLFEDFIKLKTKIVYVVSTQYMLVIRITFMY